ncbi:MAG: NAD(P)/FAD-dependent oxidoreductase [Candidatus Aenigmatarchaeota archaeon]
MNIKDRYDVIVVGCGPAGSAVAKKCAENGLDVLVLDRNQEIGTPVRCGEGLSDNAVKTLKLKLPKKCIAQKIKGAIVYAPNGKRIEIKFKGTNGYILERKIFDKWLAYEATKSGATVIAKSNVYDIIKENDFVSGVKAKIIDIDSKINSKVVVAADGVESLILRKVGFAAKNPRLVDSGYEYEMASIDLEDPHMIVLYFGTKIAKRGYIWIFPKGNDIANVGIGIGGIGYEKTAKKYLDDFILSKHELNKGSILEIKGGCIPVGGFLDNMVSNGIVGVGDAVNQVNPIHGGGIAESIKGGRIAGEVIARCVKNNDVSAKALSEYNKIWWKECGERLKKIEKVREMFEKMSDDEMNDIAEVLSGEDLVDLAHGKNYAKLVKIYLKYRAKGIRRKFKF